SSVGLPVSCLSANNSLQVSTLWAYLFLLLPFRGAVEVTIGDPFLCENDVDFFIKTDIIKTGHGGNRDL
ncbi:MAG: hypothetical protein FWE90_03550, partial [Defluviitaleaceae bacterium]|nr:hypothetical protein [Defluviitaleaceae bacterium]